MRLLMIEDDIALSAATKISLERAGYQVDLSTNGTEGLELALTGAYDILLVDRMLPGLNGTAVISAIRLREMTTPVIILTALDGINDRVEGLDAGADDYLTKPFATQELLARLRALSRRPSGWQHGKTIDWHDLSLMPWANELHGPAGKCSLSKHEADLLETFLKAGGQTLPRSMLFARIWGAYADIEDGNLDRYVHFLRRRLKTVGSSVTLKTVYGVGYRLEVGAC